MGRPTASGSRRPRVREFVGKANRSSGHGRPPRFRGYGGSGVKRGSLRLAPGGVRELGRVRAWWLP